MSRLRPTTSSKLEEENSRWIVVAKNFPGVWLAEHGVGVLNMDDE